MWSSQMNWGGGCGLVRGDGFICCHRNCDGLIPDAPELIHSYLEGEQDPSCKRNAFMMLIHVDRVRGGTGIKWVKNGIVGSGKG